MTIRIVNRGFARILREYQMSFLLRPRSAQVHSNKQVKYDVRCQTYCESRSFLRQKRTIYDPRNQTSDSLRLSTLTQVSQHPFDAQAFHAEGSKPNPQSASAKRSDAVKGATRSPRRAMILVQVNRSKPPALGAIAAILLNSVSSGRQIHRRTLAFCQTRAFCKPAANNLLPSSGQIGNTEACFCNRRHSEPGVVPGNSKWEIPG